MVQLFYVKIKLKKKIDFRSNFQRKHPTVSRLRFYETYHEYVHTVFSKFYKYCLDSTKEQFRQRIPKDLLTCARSYFTNEHYTLYIVRYARVLRDNT